MIREIRVKIKGNSPGLLMNNPKSMENDSGPSGPGKKYPPEKEAEIRAYRKKDKELYVPAESIYRSMLNAASAFKVKNRSVAGILAGSVKIEPYELGLGTDKYEIDIRSVNIKKCGRIMRARPKIYPWEVEFCIIFDEDFSSEEILKKVLEDAGKRIGILDFRPQKKGPFGTFEIAGWKKTK